MKPIPYLSIIAILCMVAGCGKYQMPPFSSGAHWKAVGNHVVSEPACLDIDFGGGSTMPLANASTGDYDLHFVGDAASLARSDARVRDYFITLLKRLPMTVDSVDFVFADRFVVLRPAAQTQWQPDIVVDADGSTLVAQAHRPASTLQPHDQLWRNVVHDKSMQRIAVVDRFYRDDKPLAIVYVLQNESRRVPFAGTFHYDIFDARNVQPVGTAMEALLSISVDAMRTRKVPGYSDFIHAADSCFMAGDYIAASNAFEQAFLVADKVPGVHWYNSACAAALAGLPDVAFERLRSRLREDRDWFVDDPNADADLQSLHADARWAGYCDSLQVRRERIEAGYNMPLRRRLLAIADSDQSIRYQYLNAVRNEPQDTALAASLLDKMRRIDAENQEAIARILDTEGFAGAHVVGNASLVYWLIVQHAPVEMQRKYFPTFAAAAERGDLSKECVALMDDRIAMFEGRPQKYGTQIVDGHLYNLQDPENVDAYRREMGMPPLAEYLQQMGVTGDR